MEIQQVADQLVEHCRKGDWEGAQRALYSQNCVSIEPEGAPVVRTEGLEGIIAKGEQFNAMVDTVHRVEVSDPLVADNFITCTMSIEATWKGAPGPSTMDEVCVYEVRDGKVVEERFYYTPQPM